MPQETFEAFYKRIINGKKGNIFTRLDWLEDQYRKMRAGDVTNFITQIVQNNQQIIMPSVPGGTADPTDPTFTGVIISPQGVLLPSDGIVYTFAVVVDGVAIWGAGDDGGSPVTPSTIVGGADTNVQYNDGGVLAGDANFTWDKSTYTLGINGFIQAGPSTGINIFGGDAVAVDSTGGNVSLNGGDGTGTEDGGGIGIVSGNGGTTGAGGDIDILGGDGGGTSGNGASIGLVGGDALTNGDGGGIYLQPGAGAGGGADGAIILGGPVNGMQVSKTGDLTLLGSAKYERHVQLTAQLTGSPSNHPTQVDFYTASGLQYATTGSKYAFTQFEIPNDWDGTDIIFEVDWFPDSGATSGTDAVRWTVEYRAIAEGELISNGTSVTLDNGAGGDTADYSQYQTKHTRFTLTYNNANQPLTKQDHVYFKISRDTSVTNDFGGSVTVTAYEVIYQSTGFPTSN